MKVSDAIHAIRNKADALGYRSRKIIARSGTVYLRIEAPSGQPVGTIRIGTHPGRHGSANLWVDPRDDESVHSALEKMQRTLDRSVSVR